MSLFRTSLRPPAVLSDEAVDRYLGALRADIDPDPDFRRRLRGVVLNRYVATREANRADLVPRTMGRLGRAVLYASFVLGVSVTGVMAASEAAVPGDVLYPLKRAIEEMRVEVLPPQFHDELAVHELSERFSELATLVERGDVAGVEALVTEVVAGSASLELLQALDGQAASRNEVLTALMGRLPEPARLAIDQALDAPAGGTPTGPGVETGSSAEVPHPTPPPGAGTSGGASTDNGESGGGGGGGASSGTTDDDADVGRSSDERGRGGSGAASPTPSGTPEAEVIDEPSATPKPKKDPAP